MCKCTYKIISMIHLGPVISFSHFRTSLNSKILQTSWNSNKKHNTENREKQNKKLNRKKRGNLPGRSPAVAAQLHGPEATGPRTPSVIVFLEQGSSSVEGWLTLDPPPASRRIGWRPPTLDAYKKPRAAQETLGPHSSLFLSRVLAGPETLAPTSSSAAVAGIPKPRRAALKLRHGFLCLLIKQIGLGSSEPSPTSSPPRHLEAIDSFTSDLPIDSNPLRISPVSYGTYLVHQIILGRSLAHVGESTGVHRRGRAHRRSLRWPIAGSTATIRSARLRRFQHTYSRILDRPISPARRSPAVSQCPVNMFPGHCRRGSWLGIGPPVSPST
jgi:hypothetical protein